jgi:hypothetical protein
MDPEGEPVAGARIWLYFGSAMDPEHTTELVATGVTAADGSFALDDPQRPGPEVRRPRRWSVYAYTPGLSLAAVHVGNASRPIEMVLAETAAISGRVLERSGRPLSGALVTAARAGFSHYGLPDLSTSFDVFPEMSGELGVRTDVDGRFDWSPGEPRPLRQD